MSIIQKLDTKLSNMIAAGEVVERPSGIIKELIENSIDAKSDRIIIRITEGGIASIQVEDNGIGMDKEDALLAFERHATSKIKTEDDLFAIATLGFRGEALPSIASVSKVTLLTNDGNQSTFVEMKYGELVKCEAKSRNRGTTITVQQLFQNTPARFKHLKSSYYEVSRVSDIVKRFACSYPHISFQLISEQKTIFQTSGNNKLEDILLQLYDVHIVKDIIRCEVDNNEFGLSLLMAQPQYTRKNNSILIYLNHRLIRSYALQNAIIEGYKNYIPADRMPIVVMNITMDYHLVDVNVHPSKMEVRISKEAQLKQFITDTIRSKLQQAYQVPETEKKDKVSYDKLQMEFVYEAKEALKPYLTEVQDTIPTVEVVKPSEPLIEVEQPVEEIINEVVSTPTQKQQVIVETIDTNVKIAQEIIQPQNIFHKLKVLAQLQGKYILCESEEGLYIVDQHAAAERVNYEKIQKLVLETNNKQHTLIPFTLVIPVNVMQNFNQLQTMLASLQIEIELFSENSIVVRSVPTWITKENEKAVLQDLVDYFIENKTVTLEDIRKSAIASAACHNSIRFNRHLSHFEMEYLIRDLAKCEHPYHCPHGRTVIILIDNRQLEKDFMRIT